MNGIPCKTVLRSERKLFKKVLGSECSKPPHYAETLSELTYSTIGKRLGLIMQPLIRGDVFQEVHRPSQAPFSTTAAAAE